MSAAQNPFDSDAESLVEPIPKKSRGRKAGVVKRQAPKKKKQPVSRPLARAPSCTASESEEEAESEQPPPAKRNKKRSSIFEESEDEGLEPITAPKLKNILWRRVASGYTSQRNYSKKGEFYIDLRVSYTHDAESPDGWKKSLITFKSCADKNSEIFKAVEKAITAAKLEYKNITPVLYPNKNE